MNKSYIINPNISISFDGIEILTPHDIVKAMNLANKAIKELSNTTMQFNINIFEALGMRNLSGLIGEYFARCLMNVSGEALVSNLHQDGYPDLLLVNTVEKKQYFNSLYVIKDNKKYPIDKEHFSPFKYGGIEVKATCGSTPAADAAKHITKPLIGEQRVSSINSFDWKAHHRDTNYLLGILWDFIDGIPTYVAAFYQDELVADDWGKIVQPKDNGGRTTSVSIMKARGVKKMCSKWVAIIDDTQYINLLAKKKWIGYNIKQNEK